MTRRGRQRHAPTKGPTIGAAFPARLRHPFGPQACLSDDAVAALHDAALQVLEGLGIRILLDEGCAIFARAGARVEEDMVFIGRDMVEAALASAPRAFTLNAANPDRSLAIETGAMVFSPGAGCPNVTDRVRGRRPGDLASYRETLKLHQHFDVIHMLAPSAEPQDIPAHLRHYDFMRGQIELSDKPAFIYARGQRQTEENFVMLQLAYGLSDDDFTARPWTKTVINSNSPRQLDRPMTRGIIDFARFGQILVITPFCLAGAMAPITVAGALVLQHAEALAGITLAQLVKPGAPCVYGAFGSNVDMK